MLDYKDLQVRTACGAAVLDRFDSGVSASKDGYQAGLDKFKKDYAAVYAAHDAPRSSPGYSKDGFADQEPVMMVTYNCRNDVVVVSGGAGDFQGTMSMTKSGFASLVVVIDILCTLILMGFYKALEKQQVDYFKKYDTETLNITKFSYMISNMPPDEFFNFDDTIFRMRLWLQFEKILQD